MQKFERFTGQVMPLPANDVDTDQIIPAQYLVSVSRDGYGENLFRRLRDSDPNFPLNQERYRGAQILVSGVNFGCGSSREHAVWALMGAGFRCVIAHSFADIFSGNAAKNGFLLISHAEAEKLQRCSSLTIDLEQQQIVDDEGKRYSFEYDPFRKHCLLNGLDDIDYIRSYGGMIESYRKNQPRFFSTLEVSKS